MIRILVRLASDCDIEDLFKWRNDAVSRRMSFNSSLINWENHTKWFNQALSCDKRILIICEDENVNKISFIKFDIEERNAFISINTNPDERGKGLSKDCLINAINFFLNIGKKVQCLKAKIKEENIASQKTFAGLGFYKYKIEDNIGYYEKILN